MIKQKTIAWLMGFFIPLAPVYYVVSVSPIYALVMGILGIAVALLIERWEK